ncbi:MAG: very short patch repair endonuclease [Gammaproteobacteria bacterium]|nr:very short patch repair endonuclease [Gammaproteobacteria bacterium]
MNQDSPDTTNRRQYRRIEKSLASEETPTTTEHDSRRMAHIRQSGTSPELLVRIACRKLGMSYRLKNRDLPGSPDIANRSRGWAIFVHGCFWHQHSGCKKATVPKHNRKYWVAKFKKNKKRDQAAIDALTDMGYKCITVWECETSDDKLIESRLANLERDGA